MEKNIKQNVYICITESLLYSRDWHNIVNQLYFKEKKVRKEWIPSYLKLS